MLFFSKKNFSTLVTLTAVSNITNTTLSCLKTASRILQFFWKNYFEDLLAPTPSAENFGFLASAVSKISRLIVVLFLYRKTHTTNNMLQYETVGNIFLVRGCKKTIVHIQETGAVAESAASHLAIT